MKREEYERDSSAGGSGDESQDRINPRRMLPRGDLEFTQSPRRDSFSRKRSITRLIPARKGGVFQPRRAFHSRAIVYTCGANATNGIGTKADKRRAKPHLRDERLECSMTRAWSNLGPQSPVRNTRLRKRRLKVRQPPSSCRRPSGTYGNWVSSKAG